MPFCKGCVMKRLLGILLLLLFSGIGSMAEGLTQTQLHATMGIVTNFILEDTIFFEGMFIGRLFPLIRVEYGSIEIWVLNACVAVITIRLVTESIISGAGMRTVMRTKTLQRPMCKPLM